MKAGQRPGARGRVLPMSLQPLRIDAKVRGADPADPDGVREVSGQVAVAQTPGTVLNLRLFPDPPQPCREAIDAVLDADWVILGPGSWFTSVMPHLLVPDLLDALVQQAEADGFYKLTSRVFADNAASRAATS